MFEDLVERAKEKEEKELKKLQRLAKDFTDLLYDIKVSKFSVTICISSWEIILPYCLNSGNNCIFYMGGVPATL